MKEICVWTFFSLLVSLPTLQCSVPLTRAGQKMESVNGRQAAPAGCVQAGLVHLEEFDGARNPEKARILLRNEGGKLGGDLLIIDSLERRVGIHWNSGQAYSYYTGRGRVLVCPQKQKTVTHETPEAKSRLSDKNLPKSPPANKRNIELASDLKLSADMPRGTLRLGDGSLLWQSCSFGQKNGDTGCQGATYRISWKTAANYCQDLRLAGRAWRLPTRLELEALLKPLSSPTSISTAREFLSAGDGPYWSRTNYDNTGVGAWTLDLKHKRMFAYGKENLGIARCVARAIQTTVTR